MQSKSLLYSIKISGIITVLVILTGFLIKFLIRQKYENIS